MRPIDLDVLERQIAGDEALRREVLALFVEEVRSAAVRIRAGMSGLPASRSALRDDLHRLKGLARAIGAMRLDGDAESLDLLLTNAELQTGNALADASHHLLASLDDACSFAATLLGRK